MQLEIIDKEHKGLCLLDPGKVTPRPQHVLEGYRYPQKLKRCRKDGGGDGGLIKYRAETEKLKNDKEYDTGRQGTFLINTESLLYAFSFLLF